MNIAHRIAAGGVILKNDSVLLVRYRGANNGTYLVGPGGALEDSENAFQAVVRETQEETGIKVVPKRILFIEDLLCKRYKMCKIWILCEPSHDDVRQTHGAQMEGIIEAGWFTRDQLASELVFPSPLMLCGWKKLVSDDWQVQCLSSQEADF